MAIITLDRQGTNEDPPPASRRRGGTRRVSPVVLLLAGALGFAVAFLLAFFVFVRTASGQAAENGVVRTAQSTLSTSDWATPLRDGDKVAVLCAAAVLLLVISAIRRRFGLAAVGASVFGGSLLISHVLKLYVFDRPALTSGYAVAGHNSFPSGHVTAAMAIVLMLMLVLPPRIRPFVVAAGALGVAWVASATVALGWHRLSDTIGGGLVVAAVCCLAAVAPVVRSRRAEPVSPVSVAVALLLPSALVTGLFLVSRTATSDNARFVAAVLLAAGASVAIMLLVHWLTLRGTRDH
jgi:membrane-associated phospholipid phosphatase